MKFTSTLSVFVIAAALLFAGGAVQADTIGTMPVLYNSSGQAVNTSGGVLPAGTYYLGMNATQPVTYFGDGSFYNAATNLYGGSVYNPTGAAGTFVIPTQGEAIDPTTVGVPNTGMGGDAANLWVTLALSGLAAAFGAYYIARSRYVASK